MMFMLDTNAASDLIHDPFGRVFTKAEAVGIDRIRISVIVAAELWFGVEKRRSARLRRRVDAFFRGVDIEPLRPPADEICGRVRAALAAAGTPIGGNDLLIAAHALALDATLVTDNTREFSRVPGLRLENWSRDDGTSGSEHVS